MNMSNDGSSDDVPLLDGHVHARWPPIKGIKSNEGQDNARKTRAEMSGTTTYAESAQSNESTTTTRSPYWLPQGIYNFRIASSVVPVFGFFFNIIVCFTLIRVKGLLPWNAVLLMCHQSVIDGLNSIFFVIVELPIAPEFPQNTMGLIQCVIYVKMVFATDAVGQWNNFIITLERFYAICYPLKTNLFTTKRIVFLVAANWMFCGGLCYGMGFLYVKLQPNGYCGQDPHSVRFTPIYGMLYMVLFYMIPMFTMPWCLIIASIFLVITNMPDIVLFMFMYCIFGMNTMSSDQWTYTFQILAKSIGPVVNPIIYSFAIPKFRVSLKDAFCNC